MTRFFAKSLVATVALATLVLTGCGESLVGPDAPAQATTAPVGVHTSGSAEAPCFVGGGGGGGGTTTTGNCEYPW